MRTKLLSLILFAGLMAPTLSHAGMYACPAVSSVKKTQNKVVGATGKMGRIHRAQFDMTAGRFKRAEIARGFVKCIYQMKVNREVLKRVDYEVHLKAKQCAGGAKGFTPQGGKWVCRKSNPRDCVAACGR